MIKKRLRYAPSPTGYLHLGGARTALFNYLLAKHEKGDFIIRTEDTDIDRNVEGGELNQIENLEWLGIISDEDAIKGGDYGPYRQTERLDIYNKYIDELLRKKIAYECWCSAEEIELSKNEQKIRGVLSPKYSRKCLHNPEIKKNVKPSIRIYVPDDQNFTWTDGVRGKISVPGKDIGDWVIRKSNGIPTYNFAVVIDDYLMKITDVLRGEEHISNTPKQIHLYQNFGWEIPNFSHLSVIIGKNGKKLSKRDESTLQFIHMYKDRGFLPEAVLNFLGLLGWSPKTEEEFFTKKQLIDKFTIDGLSKAPSMFDMQKLLWINNYYIKQLNDIGLWNLLSPFVIDINELNDDKKMEIFKIFKPQLREGIEIIDLIKLFLDEYLVENIDRQFALDNINVINEFNNKLKYLNDWKYEKIKEIINDIGTKFNIKGKLLMMPIRIAVTGKTNGPDIVGILKIFGKEKTIKRLGDFK